MPTPTITHKSWCQEHQTDDEGEFCLAGFSWGPKRDDDGSLNGDVWASQQVATFWRFQTGWPTDGGHRAWRAPSSFVWKICFRFARRLTVCSRRSASTSSHERGCGA